MFGLFLLLFQIMITFYMIVYSMKPKRSPWGRIGSLVMIYLMWFTTWGWMPGLAWGGLCWCEARSNHS